MDIVRHNDHLIEIDNRFRVERGPVLVEVEKATPELLDDAVTAPGYHRGGRDKFGRVIAIDEHEGDLYGPARQDPMTGEDIPGSGPLIRRGDGVRIKEGQPFAYLDWKGAQVWHIYEHCTEDDTGEDGAVVKDVTRWRRRGYRATEAEAIAVAMDLAHAAPPAPALAANA